MSSFQTPSYPGTENVPPTGYPSYGYQTPQPVYPTQPTMPQMPSFPSIETSYIENILRLNLGKVATVYMNFENSQWGSKIFKGVLRAAGKDHIILVDQDTGIHYLLLTIYLDYITFDTPITYEYPFFGSQGPSQFPAQMQPTVPQQQAPQPSPYTQYRKKENKE